MLQLDPAHARHAQSIYHCSLVSAGMALTGSAQCSYSRGPSNPQDNRNQVDFKQLNDTVLRNALMAPTLLMPPPAFYGFFLFLQMKTYSCFEAEGLGKMLLEGINFSPMSERILAMVAIVSGFRAFYRSPLTSPIFFF